MTGRVIGLGSVGILLASLALAQGLRPGGMPSRPQPRPAGPAPTAPAPAAAPAGAPAPTSQPSRPDYPRQPNFPLYPYGWRRQPIIAGYNPRVLVQFPSRFDWTFVPSTAGSSYPHNSAQTTYSLWVPRTYRHALPSPILFYLSQSAIPTDTAPWEELCRKYGILFAVVHMGGDEVPAVQRVRLALDVLDDVRQRMALDTDRVYLAGCSEGARTACDIAFAYPEFVGGVLAVHGAGMLREEPWLRDRARERLGLALITGELDPLRGEVENLRARVYRESEMNFRLWTVPRLGRAQPPAAILEAAYLWLESGLAARQALGALYPTFRMAPGVYPQAEAWAEGVVEEARKRQRDPRQRETALLLLEGVTRRWKGTAGAREADKLLNEANVGGREKWQALYDRRQREHLAREAQAFDEFLQGPLPLRILARKGQLTQDLVALWEQVERYGPDSREGQIARKRIDDLNKKQHIRMKK